MLYCLAGEGCGASANQENEASLLAQRVRMQGNPVPRGITPHDTSFQAFLLVIHSMDFIVTRTEHLQVSNFTQYPGRRRQECTEITKGTLRNSQSQN
jgi:hypothetical protein